jgi:hypothetical protein
LRWGRRKEGEEGPLWPGCRLKKLLAQINILTAIHVLRSLNMSREQPSKEFDRKVR